MEELFKKKRFERTGWLFSRFFLPGLESDSDLGLESALTAFAADIA